MNAPSTKPGRIVTFYSYKGGTGRSMAVANVAWILASNGKRVLVMDWDLEAPGLHRYFHPFLADKELTSSPGLIDYFAEFAVAARQQSATSTKSSRSNDAWWKPWTHLSRYSYSLDWEFPDAGTIDFVPAGQQSAAYGVRVTSFNWQELYETLGGGVLLEALKRQLRASYDYVLIDSRTGISDTSGICTVQMPDDLVLCFTLNHQNIAGAAAVAASAMAQRRKENGEPGIRIWPVPTRIELAEKERLDSARESAQAQFQRYLGHMTRVDRDTYWGTCEILYQPYYAYEEVLAAFAERPGQQASMLTAMENIARRISDGDCARLARVTEEDRQRGLKGFQVRRPFGQALARAGVWDVYLSHNLQTRHQARLIRDRLEDRGLTVWAQGQNDESRAALDAAAVFVMLSAGKMTEQQEEHRQAQSLVKRTIWVTFSGTPIDIVPRKWPGGESVRLDPQSESDLLSFAQRVQDVVAMERGARAPVESTDPQKGRWGGEADRNGRQLIADVHELTPGWFEIALEVRGTTNTPLTGDVEFHLHPTFPREVVKVQVRDGAAELRVQAYGAFTVGAVADDGETTLELDLAQDERFPQLFRDR